MSSRDYTFNSDSVIPIFDGYNFEFWKVKMMTLLRSEGLWSIVQNGIIESTSQGEVKQNNEGKHEADMMNDAKALLIIQNGVSAAILSRIAKATTSKQAWEFLEMEYQSDCRTKTIKLQDLQKDFYSLKMKESEYIQDYSSRVIEVVNQIKTLGEEMTDQKVVEKILFSLSGKYDSIVAAIVESKDIATLSIKELMGSLKSHEQRRLSRFNSGGKHWTWRWCW